MRPAARAIACAAAALALSGAVAARGTLVGPAVRGTQSDAAIRAELASGLNPYPVNLVRPPAQPLSEAAEIGRQIFSDPSLSGSGRLSCASCHDPGNHFGPLGAAATAMGGPHLTDPGVRAVPSLMYLEHQPAFSVGPDDEENETATLSDMVAAAKGAPRATKTAGSAASAANIVPQGGLFWDGRSDTLQDQALFPLLSPIEMAAGSADLVAAKLKRAPYAKRLVQLFGPGILDNPGMLVGEAMFAVARFEFEDPRFHPYSSKFDSWLEGKARFTPAEMRGYVLFNDKDKANCGGCHLDQPGADGTPPVFTDDQFEALSPPRNQALAINADPNYHDLGLCGPYRDDMRDQTQFCGMFLTPTLRNSATRRTFFHNGVFHTLRQVMNFYDFRDVAPEKVYPRKPDGTVDKDDDIPARFRANVDVTDPPFDRHPGEAPAMTAQEQADIIAFLGALTDGYRPRAK